MYKNEIGMEIETVTTVLSRTHRIELFRSQFFLFGILHQKIAHETSQLPVVYMYLLLFLTEIQLASTE